MNKYIDAEKLIAEIRQHIHDPKQIEDWRYRLKMEEDNALLERIVNIITSLQQEQPEVDLEKEMKEYFSLWRQGASDEGCVNANSQFVSIYDCHRIARHFWSKGYNARKEE